MPIHRAWEAEEAEREFLQRERERERRSARKRLSAVGNSARRTPLVFCSGLLLVAVVALSGCPEPQGKYTCTNGTPQGGAPSGSADVERCTSCNEDFLLTATNTCSNDLDNDNVLNVVDVDDDGDGLIELRTLDDLNNVRYVLDGTGYQEGSDGTKSTTGCGNGGTVRTCSGYELTRSLDFADGASYANGTVNSDWRPNSANSGAGDNAGWVPIGSCNADVNNDGPVCGDSDDTPFTATFSGNGFTITGLYARNTSTIGAALGLFGAIGGDAAARAIGVANFALYGTAATAADYIGGLVGHNVGAIIWAYVTGTTNSAGGGDFVGGLVGFNAGSITASYATGDVDAGGGTGGFSGGLVGWNDGGTITASYATGNAANTGGGRASGAGGLVGRAISNRSVITASYATGDADVGGGGLAEAGRLVAGISGDVRFLKSYGFGTPSNGEIEEAGAPPDGVTNASGLTAANAGDAWANSASDDWDWDFGSSSQNPALVVDFNGDEQPTWQEFGSQR